jgi:hypothetical protein
VAVELNLVEKFANRTGPDVIEEMPPSVAIGPIESPLIFRAFMTQLRDVVSSPIWPQISPPRRTTFGDGDRCSSDDDFQADTVVELDGDPFSAVLSNESEIEVGDRRHTKMLEPS